MRHDDDEQLADWGDEDNYLGDSKPDGRKWKRADRSYDLTRNYDLTSEEKLCFDCRLPDCVGVNNSECLIKQERVRQYRKHKLGGRRTTVIFIKKLS